MQIGFKLEKKKVPIRTKKGYQIVLWVHPHQNDQLSKNHHESVTHLGAVRTRFFTDKQKKLKNTFQL